MISTGGTIEAAGSALLAAGWRPPVVVVASLPLPDTDLPLRVVLAPLLVQAIERLHAERSLADLLARG